ncbi:MAG: hypothetical protein HETSPECPRED_002856 [Heterodermia speciosa]|uniref:Uncharacterized protein n=1 Tax=Heterodermia speciosa TaxID=116794 RepID=A0A8H3J5B3_9LECA|nr:MAG: hypothetical protein HETSPECPRED_002856 [Heterodermia speciosa]
MSDRDQAEFTEPDDTSAKKSIGSKLYRSIKRIYMNFREFCELPSRSRGGIRLVTPIDVKKRRLYRIKCAATGLLSCILSILAIELTLKWNKVRGVYSITSTGQYAPLIIGVGGVISVCWSLMRQESKRRRDLKRRQAINQSEDGIELDTLSHTLADALSHAFAQPDIGFFTNGGALSNDSGVEEGEIAPESSDAFQRPHNEVLMSGALDVHPDLEAQTPANGRSITARNDTSS